MGEEHIVTQQPPPPGWVAPTPPPPGPPPGPLPGPLPGRGSGYGYGPLVHKPGVVPLRPLGLGDFFDGAFKTIRRNPRAMVGLAALVTTAFMVVPVVVTLSLAAAGHLSADLAFDPATSGDGSALDAAAVPAASYLGSFFGLFATVVLNGMLVRVVAEAVLGRRTTAGQAWAATRGRMLRLVGLMLLDLVVIVLLVGLPVVVGVVVGLRADPAAGFLVGVPLGLLAGAAAVFVQVRYFQLAAPALVLERTGVVASLRRAGRLSQGQFWRLLGILLLTGLVAGVVGQVVAVPLALVGALGPLAFPGTGGALLLVLSSYVSQIVVGSLTTPFTSAVTALQYVDQRIRKEGLDVELIAASQRGPTGPR
jgi:hypothetical protein